jgi:signal transduction histidine kinase
MLSFMLDTSSAAANDVQDRLDDLAKQQVPSADSDSVGTLLAHGRLLHELLPRTNGIIQTLFALPSRSEEESLRSVIVSRHNDAREVARGFRILLYVTSLLLVAVLVHLGMRLRSRAQLLQRRAAFEHVIAGISTRFINSHPYEIDAHVEQALLQLAQHVGAAWAVYMTSETGARMHAWCQEAVTFPPGWLEEISAQAARMTTTPEEIIHFPADTLRLVATERNGLGAAACSWICVVRTSGTGQQSLLGFGLPQPIPPKQSNELGLLHMALDAISNAIARTTLERERAQLEARLHQARRMEIVGSFASGIAHNFNNIVGAILGYTEIAEGQFTGNSQAARNSVLTTLGEIRKAGERARDLVDQILTFGRRRDGLRRPVNMQTLVTEVTSLLHASLPESIELVVGEVPEAATVLGVPAQLQQLIINLSNNAAQAMEGDGRVEIDLQMREVLGPQSLTHGEVEQGRYVCIGVTDTGSGMDEAVLERLFEPFFTTRAAGNGLGLATVHEIVRELGGVMDVQTAPGLGSRFEAWLPRFDAYNTAPIEDAPVYPFGHGETLLVVGDEAAPVAGDEEVLAALGYEPVGFARVGDAIAVYRATPERFDGVVLGHFTSVTTALDLAATLHEATPELPILLTTTSIHQIDIGPLAAAGISEVVQRPINSTEIAHALKRCLEGANSLNSRLAS